MTFLFYSDPSLLIHRIPQIYIRQTKENELFIASYIFCFYQD